MFVISKGLDTNGDMCVVLVKNGNFGSGVCVLQSDLRTQR